MSLKGAVEFSFLEKGLISLPGIDGACVINLKQFNSSPLDVVKTRVPANLNGIYSFFRGFQLPSAPEELKQEIFRLVSAPKFEPRNGVISPYFGVTIRSHTSISAAKHVQMEKALEADEFRSAIRVALMWNLFFQTPLYIGKSTDLRSRLSEHLAGRSLLKERLATADINIDTTSILLIPVPLYNPITSDSKANSNDGSVDVHHSIDAEALFEEVFSRLFSPGFSVRLG